MPEKTDASFIFGVITFDKGNKSFFITVATSFFASDTPVDETVTGSTTRFPREYSLIFSKTILIIPGV